MKIFNANELFNELCQLASSDQNDQLLDRIEKLEELGIELRVEATQSDPELMNEDSEYTEVTQNCTIWIGQFNVYEWEETYWGSFGGMDAGWWVEQGHTSIDFEVETLLELLELLPETPEIPKPGEEQDEDEDEL